MRIANVIMIVLRHMPPENKKTISARFNKRPHWMPPRRGAPPAAAAAGGGFGATPCGARAGLITKSQKGVFVRGFVLLTVQECLMVLVQLVADAQRCEAFEQCWYHTDRVRKWGKKKRKRNDNTTRLVLSHTLEKTSLSIESSRNNWPAKMILISLGSGLPGYSCKWRQWKTRRQRAQHCRLVVVEFETHCLKLAFDVENGVGETRFNGRRFVWSRRIFDFEQNGRCRHFEKINSFLFFCSFLFFSFLIFQEKKKRFSIVCLCRSTDNSTFCWVRQRWAVNHWIEFSLFLPFVSFVNV